MNFICNRMKSDGGAFWNNVYITPWCRVAAFCVGLFLGIIFYKKPKAYLSRVLLHTHILRFMIQKQYFVRCGVPWKIVFYVTAFFLFNSNYNYIIYQYDGILISIVVNYLCIMLCMLLKFIRHFTALFTGEDFHWVEYGYLNRIYSRVLYIQ